MQPARTPAGSPRTRRRRLGFEGLEPRDLPSGATAAVLGGPTTAPSFASGTTPLPSFPRGLQPNLSLVPGFETQAFLPPTPTANSAYAANTHLDQRTNETSPTPNEVARQYFLAKFEGSYTIGPGRFQGQALTIHASSRVQGGSNQFLKGKAQFLLSTPADPANGTVTGVVSLFAQNYLQSGNLVIIDVGNSNQVQQAITPVQTGGPTTLSNVNGQMLPTQMPWAFDATSAGAYGAPSGFTQGGGQLSIVYTPDKHPRAGTLGSGKVTFLLQGLINTTSILNVVDKGIN